MRNYQYLPRPQRRKDAPKRTIDQFYDEAISYANDPELFSAESAEGLEPSESCSSLPEPPSLEASLHNSRLKYFRGLRYWIIIIALGLANAGDATEIQSLNFCLSDSIFVDEILRNDFGGRGATISAAIFLGMLIGGLLTGVFGDEYGRRPTLLAGLFLNSISGIGSALSPYFAIIAFFRFCAGLGVGSIMSSLMPLSTEISPPSKRGFFVTIIVSFFTLGQIFVALAANIMFDENGNKDNSNTWRWFLSVCSIPTCVATILVYFFVPESPRFLALQYRLEEACVEANRVADAMGYRGPQLEIEEIEYHYGTNASTENVRISEDRKLMIMNSKPQRKQVTIIDTAKTMLKPYSKELWKQTTLLQLLTFAMSFGSSLNIWINELFKSIKMNNVYMHSLLFSVSSVPGSFAAALLIERVGRNSLLFCSMLFSAFSLLVFSAFLENHLLVTLSACGFHGFLVISRNVLLCVTSELFPTEVRGTGVGICTAIGRLASMSAQYVYGKIMDNHHPRVLVINSCFSILFGAGLSLFLKDMSSQPLADGINSGEIELSSGQVDGSFNEDVYNSEFEIGEDDEIVNEMITGDSLSSVDLKTIT